MKELTDCIIKSMLGRFVYDRSDLRPELTKPFLQDGNYIATDCNTIIRIPAEGHPGLYKENPKAPACKRVIPSYYPEGKIDKESIIKAIGKLGLDIDADFGYCPSCQGTGDVEWTFTDIHDNIYYKTLPCPVCDGMGETPNGHNTLIWIKNTYTRTEYLIRILRMMELLEVDEVEVSATNLLLFTFPGGIDVTVATMINEKDYKTADIWLKPLREE